MMVKQKFTWFFDMATSADNVQNLKVYAGGEDVYTRLSPFFAAYKHYKLGAVRLKFVAAATLPVDPTGLSYEVGEQTADPRDLFNPGLVRITNGEDVAPIVSMNQYYATLLDPRWYKFNMQKGFMRSAVPLYWGIGQIRQDMLPGHVSNVIDATSDFVNAMYPISGSATVDTQGNLVAIRDADSSSSYALFQTGEKIRMGWMPTDYFERFPIQVQNGAIGTREAHGVNIVPEVPLLDIVLPKSHKTKFYYRVYVEETVYFKDAVAINPYPYTEDSVTAFDLPIDRFIYPVVTGAAYNGGQMVGLRGNIEGITPIQNYGGGFAVTPIDQSYDSEGGNGE